MRLALRGTAGIGIPLATYSGLVEPNLISVEHVEFAVAGWPRGLDGFRIAQLSDFHYGPYTGDEEIRRAVDATQRLEPNLIVLTGDFITADEDNDVDTAMSRCAALLGALKAPDGVFACLGNHDVSWKPQTVIGALRTQGISVLRNSNVAIERGGARFWLAGLDDGVLGHADYDLTLRGIPANDCTVMLAHEPDLADLTARFKNVVAQLSGHSHGGQVRLPLIGCPFLPTLAEKYPYGYYRVGGLHLYTNRGIGTIVLPFRFNATPEVTLINIRCSRG